MTTWGGEFGFGGTSYLDHRTGPHVEDQVEGTDGREYFRVGSDTITVSPENPSPRP